MDENGEILLLHASKNNERLFILPFYMTESIMEHMNEPVQYSHILL